MKSNRTENFSVGIAKSIGRIFFAAILISTTLMPAANPALAQPPNSDHGPFCAIQVPNNTAIFDSYTYRTPNGTIRKWTPGRCPGHLVGIAPNIHGWIEDGRYSLSSGNFSKIGGVWTVPNGPSSRTDTPTSFFFNGLASNSLCDNNTVVCYLMQPVLGNGCARKAPNWDTCVVGGEYWWHAPILWDGAADPNTFYYSGPTTNIATGHHIQGNVTWTNPASECSITGKGYRIVSKDNDVSGDSWTLTWCDTTTVFGKGYAAVFEAKGCNGGNCNGGGISLCNNLPNSPNINFTSITSTPSNGVTWASTNDGQSPNCGWGMNPAFGSSTSSNSGPITLRWNPACSSPPC